jgi:hypothetical protein
MERYLERECVLMPRTTTIIYGLHSEVPKGFQGSFGGYYAFAPGCPPRPPRHRFTPTSVNALLGPLNIFAFATLARATVARYN